MKLKLLKLHYFLLVTLLCPYIGNTIENPPNHLGINEAIAITLENQKEIQIHNDEIDVQSGILRQTAGPFDPIVDGTWKDTYSYIYQTSFPPDRTFRARTNNSQYTANLSKKNRVGTLINLSSQISNIHTKSQPPPLNTKSSPLQISFQIDQPLLRDFLYGLDAMIEQAQKLEVSAAWYSAAFFISNRITNTVINYWNMVAFKKFIQIQEETLQEFFVLTDRIKKLIEGGMLAATDINQPLAQIATQELQILIAKQQYYNSIQSLKFAMGIGDQCTTFDSDVDADDFPPIQEEYLLKNLSCPEMMKIIGILSDRRLDIIASSLHSASISFLLKGSKNSALPRLDIFGGVNLDENTIETRPPTSFYNRQFDVFGGVIFSTPIFNDKALGLVQQRNAELNQSQLQTQLLKEQAAIQFFQYWKSNLYLISELKQADIAIERDRILFEKELKKLNAGYSTVFVVIDFYNLLTNSLLAKADLYRQYAQNIVQFRFITGTLLKLEKCSNEVEIEPVTIWPKEL
ncbi:MAG: TolC family protein [Parachlamydiaceae bacterium]|nr:TolC family protein [Parachlamydiaceae bacterium]